MTLEELKQEFTDNGFQVNENSFIKEFVTYSQIVFNGQPMKQEHRQRLVMNYVCDGSICDVIDGQDCNEYPIYQFEILDDRNNVADVICIEKYSDLVGLGYNIG